MAIIHEEVLVIRVSKLIKENADAPQLINTDIKMALEQVVQELVGDGIIVEVDGS